MRSQGWPAPTAAATRLWPGPDALADAWGLTAKALLRLGLAGLVATLASAGVLAGLELGGSADYDTRLGEASVQVVPAWHGQVEITATDERSVRARAFSAPVSLRAKPSELNTGAVLRAAAGDKPELRAARRSPSGASTRRSLETWLPG